MHKTSLKITSLSLLALAFTAGTAFADEGKNCDHKKKAAMKTEAAVLVTPQTRVLSSTQEGVTTAKAQNKIYSFEDALKLCQDKGAADLQACVDYKTGVSQAKS